MPLLSLDQDQVGVVTYKMGKEKLILAVTDIPLIYDQALMGYNDQYLKKRAKRDVKCKQNYFAIFFYLLKVNYWFIL